MKLTRIATVALLSILLLSSVACGTQQPSYQPPIPTFTSGTGAAIGQVMYPSSVPATGKIVYIFKGEEEHSFKSCSVDSHGYYIFNSLPPDNYEIYLGAPSSPGSLQLINGAPATTITVSASETVTVPILYYQP